MIRSPAGIGIPEPHPPQAAVPPAAAPVQARAAEPTDQPPHHRRGAKAFLAGVSRRLGIRSERDDAIQEIGANLKKYEEAPTRELARTIIDQHRQLLDKAPPSALDASYGQYRSVEMDNPKFTSFLEKISPISRQVEKIRSDLAS